MSQTWLRRTRAGPATARARHASKRSNSIVPLRLNLAGANPAAQAEWLDERLNEVYTSVRLLLPPNSFAAVKKEQIEWLKERDAAGSVEEKCKSMEARIKALQELVW